VLVPDTGTEIVPGVDADTESDPAVTVAVWVVVAANAVAPVPRIPTAASDPTSASLLDSDLSFIDASF